MTQEIYLNTASCGLIDPENLQAAYAFDQGMLAMSSRAAEELRSQALPRIRATVASFIDAPASNVALIPNFSWGLNALVQSLRGDERVLLYNNDFPSVLDPFRINRFQITWITSPDGFTIDLEELKELVVRERIDLVVISEVQWLTGFRIDLAALSAFCRERGVLLIADNTQSLGAVPFSARELGLDAMLSSNYKWMNAGFGTGIMYLSDSFLERYTPVVGGFGSYVLMSGQPSHYVPGIRSYEPGHLNMHGLLVLESAISVKLKQGMETIAAHNTGLIGRLLERIDQSLVLGPAHMDNRGSIVVLKDRGGLYEHLQKQGIVCIRRGELIRLGAHFHNTETEIGRLADVLDGI